MTPQPESTRSAALRELLVDVAGHAPRRERTAFAGRTALAAIAAGVGAAALIVTLQTAPHATPKGVLTQPPSDSIIGPSTAAGSRVKIYKSLDELVADSGAIVVGAVSDQQPGGDGTIVFTIEVEQSFAPGTLGVTSPVPAVVVDEGGVIRVRTFGDATSLPPAPIELGGRFLLFLTPTGLPTAGADEFFITGVVAGVYRARGDGFVRVSADGDVLPGELSAEDLR